ncbi:MAG: hypothetical protein EA384_06275 [Spirochaetaceae bacterium]|nr:MAG: hypothetical protein EA384_06275 [Spirochaetaceae bacterium]
MLRRSIVLVAVLGVICTAPLAAAEPPVGVPSPGWVTWSMNLDPSPPPRDSGLSQAEFDELLAAIQRIGALYRRTPHLRQPSNVEVSPSRVIQPRVGGRDATGPVRAEFALYIYRPVFDFHNPRSYFRMQINDPWVHERSFFEDDQGPIHLAWPRLETLNGRQRYWRDERTVIEHILPAGREPWLPVSQERWIRLLIDKTENELQQHYQKLVGEAAERRAQATRSYERGIAMASRYRNEPNLLPGVDDQMREMMAQSLIDTAEATMEMFERNERALQPIAAALAARDYDALEAAGDRGRAMMGRHLLALEAELAGLAAAERAAPAYGFEHNPAMYWMPPRPPKRPSLLLNDGDTNAYALLAPNPDFLRHDLPAGQIQSITILNRLWPEFDERLESEMDWRALAGMVR